MKLMTEMKLTTFVVLLVQCSFVWGQGVDTCVAFEDDPACGCTLQDGKVIDLKTLGLQNGKPAYTKENGDNTYTYNPCYQYSVGGSGCTNVAGCQQGGGEDRSLGKQTNVKYSKSSEDIVVKYEGGVATRTFEVTLKCKQGEDEFTYNEEKPPLHYKFTLSTRCACPDQCSGGSSGGSKGGGGGSDPGVVGIVLLSVFILAVVVYFVAGMIIMRVKFNKTGSDVIPNKEFWFTLPFLVKDGVLFTISPCVNWYHSRRSGYGSMK